MTGPANEAFFIRDGDWLVPTERALGPWTAGALHGRVVIGILGAEIERQHGDAAYMPARLTVDLYRAPSLAPLKVETRLARDGHRIKVVDAELISEGRSGGRATCQLLRRTVNPPGQTWTGPTWDVPPPEALPDPTDLLGTMQGMWAVRRITGALREAAQRRVWLRELRALVQGEALTPFARVAAGVDYASPMAHNSDQGLGFINSDVTLYLHRLPQGEWIGYESVSHEASEGVAVGHCDLYDVQGRIGWASTCALAQTRIPTSTPPKTA